MNPKKPGKTRIVVILSGGRGDVRLLGAILAPKLAQDAERLAAWNSARRVKGVPGGGPVSLDEEVTPPVVKVA